MKRQIYLYLGDYRADLDDDSLVAWTYTREEMENPTLVKNSYSQTVTLPGTSANAEIFGHFYRLDKSWQNGVASTGPNFDPLKKMPFKIYDETGAILEQGYAKLDTVTRAASGRVSWSISLYGGLGGFLYGLKYNTDGSEKTLADLWLWNGDTSSTPIQIAESEFRIAATYVQDAWNRLASVGQGTTLASTYDMINFAPAYNGLPSCDFSADRAVYKGTSCPNLYTTSGDYGPKDGADGYILVELENEHTEWEMQDLRSYLQRPVFRLMAFLVSLTATENSGDYTFILGSSFFNAASNPYYRLGWITLPMFDRDNYDPAQFPMSALFEGTSSPADYLIAIAKTFGLVFRYDKTSNTVILDSRDAFYNNAEPIDIGDRICRDEDFSFVPYVIESGYYLWQCAEIYGEWAAQYADLYNVQYGAKVVSTGFEFDADQMDVLEDVEVLNGAADVLEASRFFQVLGGAADPEYGVYLNYYCKFAAYEEVSWQLYYTDSEGEEQTLDCEPTAIGGWAPMHYSGKGSANYDDFLPKVQLHGDDNSSEDGSGVLLFFEGMADLPVYQRGGYAIQEVNFRLTDDLDCFDVLNGGTPCWILTGNTEGITQLPSFRRWHFTSGVMTESMDFGDPRQIATADTFVAGKGIYDKQWKTYMADRLSREAKVLTCKVRLDGLNVGEDLLRRFFWLDGAIWSLNKITDYSLTSQEPTECEFVKVVDVDAYMNGQSY